MTTRNVSAHTRSSDTRHTGRLLDHFGIEKPTISYHDHNEQDRAATSDEIRRAYRTAMKEMHPDRHQGPGREAGRARAEDQAKLLNRAYATLSKPESRRQYDQTIRTQAMQDELMSRYVGGFVEQWQSREAEQFMRPTPTDAERREQARDTRQAMVTLLTAFVALAVIIIVLVVLYAVGQTLVNALF